MRLGGGSLRSSDTNNLMGPLEPHFLEENVKRRSSGHGDFQMIGKDRHLFDQLLDQNAPLAIFSGLPDALDVEIRKDQCHLFESLL